MNHVDGVCSRENELKKVVSLLIMAMRIKTTIKPEEPMLDSPSFGVLVA